MAAVPRVAPGVQSGECFWPRSNAPLASSMARRLAVPATAGGMCCSTGAGCICSATPTAAANWVRVRVGGGVG
eukprot:scaffold52634_cov45-Phaeocystis_antarctica.AAC.1